MPLDRTNLVGIWCARCGGYLFFNLIFRPDGTGFAEGGNCVLTNALLFEWRVSGDDLLISGRETIHLNEQQDGVVHLPWAFEGRIRITLCSVILENGDEHRTLSLASAVDEDWPLEYAAGNPKYDVSVVPDFSWMQRLPRSN